jgi:hypothetical protein
MSNLRVPNRLLLSHSLNPDEVSQAWEYLYNLSNLPLSSNLLPNLLHPQPPGNLEHLSDSDWFLLGNLLARELSLKENLPLH